MSNRTSVTEQLESYHSCIGEINQGCRKLESALQKLGQPLSWANNWVHHRESENNDRIGVLFYDMLQNRQRWVSVPIYVFDNDTFDNFAKKYCKIDEIKRGKI